MIRYVLSRVGCLLLMVGSLLLVLGVAAERSGQPAFNFLFIGILVSITGFFLWRKLSRKPRQSTRFSLFKKRDQKEDEEHNSDDQGWGDGFYD